MAVRALLAVLLVLLLVACERSANRPLDLKKITVEPDARLRTDLIGEGPFARRATFVLVDATNHGSEGAFVTLAGRLDDDRGAVLSDLKPQSLWLPAGQTRLFSLVDRAQQIRVGAASAYVVVRSATIPPFTPASYVDQIREVPDNGNLVVQGVLHNDADRAGEIAVVAAFHGADRRPMTRPFSLVKIAAHDTKTVQFVSPPGAAHGTIFVGDTSY